MSKVNGISDGSAQINQLLLIKLQHSLPFKARSMVNVVSLPVSVSKAIMELSRGGRR